MIFATTLKLITYSLFSLIKFITLVLGHTAQHKRYTDLSEPY